MKKIVLWIALLMGSVTDPLLAQIGEINYAFDSRLDAHAFKRDYPDFLEPTAFEVQLSKGNRLLLMSKKYSGSRLVQRPDSLLRRFWNEYSRFITQLPDDTEGTSVHYVLRDGEAPQLRWKKYPQSTSEFSVMNNELVQVKSVQDTLHISVNKPNNQQADLYLLVNDLRELPQMFDEIREKTGYLIQSLEKKTDPIILERSPEVYGRYLGDRQVQVANFGSDMLIFSPAASLGYIRGNWMTSLNAEVTLFMEKSPLKPRVGYHQQYFFDQSPEGQTRIYQNGFVMAGLSFFEKRGPVRVGNKEVKQTGQLMVGYLVHRTGNYYEPNTWRVSGGINLTPLFKIEPEVYFNGAFKNLSPGVRLTIGF
ncbi:hypothetical protein [Telluribacter sp.]|jgi:hypothetical protein|uniref:hypothetical protein n=1 Tax=Telluribacter sp. TaxID=1978767 RepID=UPI002E101012|nr:hypothetical protein [Telluribacter sp.]